MDEAEDLARRFLSLWSDYLTALAGEPKTTELLQRWLALSTAPLRGGAGDENVTGEPAGTRARAASAAGASGQRDDAVDQFARRLDELETRIAALETGRPIAGRTRT